MGYGSWGRKELDMTEWLTLSLYCSKFFFLNFKYIAQIHYLHSSCAGNSLIQM